MGGKRSGKKTALGAALKKKQHNVKDRKDIHSSAGRHVSQTDGGEAVANLESYLEANSLDDFIASAVFSGRQFAAEKENAVMLEAGGNAFTPESFSGVVPNMDFTSLNIPRRPSWDRTTTAAELNMREKESFLNWRRDLAALEAASNELSITPFEKNLEVWRQLWRVIERSDIVIQIVDARNPMFYRSKDLEAYVKEVSSTKRTMLIVNKSDFLTKEQRKIWADFFKKDNVDIVFFSAKLAQEKLDEEARLAKLEEERQLAAEQLEAARRENGDFDDEDEDEVAETPVVVQVIEEKAAANKLESVEEDEHPVFSRDELMVHITKIGQEILQEVGVRPEDKGLVKFGMVGFPNVGKSSVINSLLGAATHSHAKQRVAVGATPGKTKHFQTMILSDLIMLCDCPGLVFPSFVNSKSEMICCGVLPLAQMRDHIGPSTLLVQRIPKVVLEHTYGIKIPTLKAAKPTDPVDPYAFLEAYAANRGFMTTGRGGPDSSRAARVVLKDYVNGKLLYCHAPTDANDEEKVFFDPHELAKSIEFGVALDEIALNEDEAAENAIEQVEDNLEDAEVKKVATSKRLKKHGRKGRKGRDKNPYDDSDMLGSASGAHVHVAGKKNRTKQGFKRVTLPHHPSYKPNV